MKTRTITITYEYDESVLSGRDILILEQDIESKAESLLDTDDTTLLWTAATANSTSKGDK